MKFLSRIFKRPRVRATSSRARRPRVRVRGGVSLMLAGCRQCIYGVLKLVAWVPVLFVTVLLIWGYYVYVYIINLSGKEVGCCYTTVSIIILYSRFFRWHKCFTSPLCFVGCVFSDLCSCDFLSPSDRLCSYHLYTTQSSSTTISVNR